MCAAKPESAGHEGGSTPCKPRSRRRSPDEVTAYRAFWIETLQLLIAERDGEGSIGVCLSGNRAPVVVQPELARHNQSAGETNPEARPRFHEEIVFCRQTEVAILLMKQL